MTKPRQTRATSSRDFCSGCVARLTKGTNYDLPSKPTYCDGCGKIEWWMFTLECDRCKTPLEFLATMIKNACRDARQIGWRLSSDEPDCEAICPDCQLKEN